MAHATEHPTEYPQAFRSGTPPVPVTPGKVAMWLFLATEIMFFTGLIGSYIVLRSGSPGDAYSNQFSPASSSKNLPPDPTAVVLESVGPHEKEVAEIVHKATKWKEEKVEHVIHTVEHINPFPIATGLPKAEAEKLKSQFEQAQAKARTEPLVWYNWPLPYDYETNPLSIDLTALNTFFLICSSVTMVLALAAIQKGDVWGLRLYLLATTLIGALFLSIQVYEYYQLTTGHLYPIGISKTGHFRPDVSLFASCFFTMTGFHGAHVTGGVILLACITIQSFRGTYTRASHSSVELAGLYWHFVDLVWIILFTVVYLI
jgi:cytochrome c oxidase subunit III